jgi:predicted esterase
VTGDLGIMGHSLGGQVAFFSMAVDPRLRAGVVSCGIGTLASFEQHGISHNPAWFVPRLRSFGDVSAVAGALTGQRVMVSAGRSDPLFPWDGVREVVAAFPEGSCDFRPFDGGHELPAMAGRAALDWLLARLRS